MMMLVDIQGNTAKQRARASLERRQLIFRSAFLRTILAILRKQYRDAAANIESYEFNFNWAVEKYNQDLRNLYLNNYKRILKEFGEKILEEISQEKAYIKYERKSFIDDFWRYVIPWMNINTATKVVQVNQTTKKHINLIVKKGMRNDQTNKEIAKKINELAQISLPFRAARIARTETHSAANFGTDKAMDTSRLMKEKEWISALDERTRSIGSGSSFDHVAANSERVAMNDTFKRTGENLRFPGDYEYGSAGNIINCRCQALYHTKVQTQQQGNVPVEKPVEVEQQFSWYSNLQQTEKLDIPNNDFLNNKIIPVTTEKDNKIKEIMKMGKRGNVSLTKEKAENIVQSLHSYTNTDYVRIRKFQSGGEDALKKWLVSELPSWDHSGIPKIIKKTKEQIKDISLFNKISKKYEGEIYRRIHLPNEYTLEEIKKIYGKENIISMEGFSSWTNTLDSDYLKACSGNKKKDSILFVIEKNKSGVDISYFSAGPKEKEVLMPNGKKKFKIKDIRIANDIELQKTGSSFIVKVEEFE